VLLDVWPPLPFMLGAAILLGLTALVYFSASDTKGDAEDSEGHAPRPRELYGEVRRLVADEPPLRRVLVASSLWELALAALRSFVILFITVGLGRTTTAASGVLAIAGVGVVLGALLAGKLADRVGHRAWCSSRS
jgi:predicted MFS family arabinose efflux permease